MVDRIKFYLYCIISEAVIENKKSLVFKKDNQEYIVFDYNKISFLAKTSTAQAESKNLTFSITDSEDNDSSNISYKNLFIVFSRVIGERAGRLTIHQNLRKNYIHYKNLSPFHDLKFLEFIEIINLYADEFEVPRQEFWKAKITQLELGVNLRFKMNISMIINSLSQMRRVPKRIKVDNSALYFRAKKFELVMYDKIDRASEQREIFSDRDKIERKRLSRKISRNNSILRFELRIKSVKQFNQRNFKNKIESLDKIKNHFVEIGDALYSLAGNITFVDVANPEISKRLITSQLKSKGKKEFDDYLIYLGLKSFGVVKFINFIAPILSTQIKYSYANSLEKLYNSYRTKNDYVRITFLNKLRRRFDSLSKNDFESEINI